ncbi:ATP-binding cassette domain-containing protein [Aggregatibacter actinomycetemcomitans]|uniref:peptidase domain-containing ABC transporter n=2 Tax=Aggregatibacter actinomycetemcomitans TaxID=714 RepID=UPI0011D95E94|nr:ATP-binding cassette domain-containing protein [Aggregatibacter actinomycetemcomitans]TYA22384.1 ATP-binding cassette domain-containing protein [Aggregatibacter actinomycetemcomitans]
MLFSGIHASIAALEQILILWVGETLVIENTMTLGMYVAFNSYRGLFSSRMTNLINIFFNIRILALYRERIADIALNEAEEDTYQNLTNIPKKVATLELKNLTFSYNQFDKPIIKDISLIIPAGKSVAIKAPSGSGKTTLLKLMSGLLKSTSGEVYFDGININQIGLPNYRSKIAMVLQEDKFFSGSIIENIVSFEDQYDLEFAIKCAKLAKIHNEIMKMPMNYETRLGELGNNLSGGQRQRLFIARALYKRPYILFMDEATSYLDEKNEKAINISISQLNITRVIVAHRQSTIDSADYCVELDKLNKNSKYTINL